MSARLPLSVSALLLATLVGCSKGNDYVEKALPQLELSSEFVEFGLAPAGETLTKTVTLSNTGELGLGIDSIYLGTSKDSTRGMPGSFTLHWNPNDLQVPVSDTGSSSAKVMGADTGTDTGDTDTAGDTDPDTSPVDELFVMPPGARLPVSITFDPSNANDNYDSIVVQTIDGPSEGVAAMDRTYRDVDTTWKMAYLHGIGESSEANVLVTPRNVDFGFVWPGQVDTKYVAIKNVGDGPLTVLTVERDHANCVDAIQVTKRPADGTLIQGGRAEVVEITFTPVTDRAVQCRLFVHTNDGDSGRVEVRVKANSGVDPTNQAPTVQIHSPPPGYQHQGWGPIPMELTVFDANEPATNLTCKVRTSLQGWEDGAPALTNCIPPNESGHFELDVPLDYQDAGLDVLTVQVTDSAGVTRRASVPVLINAGFPPSDDDGDGFGSEDPEWPDCDDTNINTYPLAAEVYDGLDNDCDFLIDEGTNGFDDDQDGMSEVDGDCNDTNPDTYKGAPEIQDNADNDCDGVIDETTSAYDDDGDGFAELDLDCDDTDPTVNPAVPEICGDGIDNNCNGLKDTAETCVAVDSEPMLIGRINLNRTAIEELDSTQASVYIFEADGDDISHEWQAKDGEGVIDNPTAPAMNWTAPELPTGYGDGKVYRLYYIGSDDDENQVWDFAEVHVYPNNDLDLTLLIPIEGTGGCSMVPAAPMGAGLGLGLSGLLLLFRRRRD